jgi:hypothetical protein
MKLLEPGKELLLNHIPTASVLRIHPITIHALNEGFLIFRR